MAGYEGESGARYRKEEEEEEGDREVKSYFAFYRLYCFVQSMSTLKMSMGRR